MERVPVLKIGDILLVSIQIDMEDQTAVAAPGGPGRADRRHRLPRRDHRHHRAGHRRLVRRPDALHHRLDLQGARRRDGGRRACARRSPSPWSSWACRSTASAPRSTSSGAWSCSRRPRGDELGYGDARRRPGRPRRRRPRHDRGRRPGPPQAQAIGSDEDVVRVRQLVRTVAVAAKLSLVDQTKLVTAASELARNTLIYGGGGTRRGDHRRQRPAARASGSSSPTQGPGIADLDLALTDGYTTGGGLGPRPERRPPAGRRVRHRDRRRRRAPGSRSPSGPGERRRCGRPDAGIWFRVESRQRRQRRPAGGGTPRRAARLRRAPRRRPGHRRRRADQQPGQARRRGRPAAAPGRAAPTQAGVELVAIDSGPGMADLTVSARRRPLHRRHPRHRPGRDRPAGQLVRRLLRARSGHRPGRAGLAGRAGAAPAWAGGADPADHRRAGQRRRVRGPRRRRAAPGAGLRRPGARAAGRRRRRGGASPRSATAPAGPPAAVVEHLHRAMSHTRGAALAVAELDPAAGVLRYAGLGNIAGTVARRATAAGGGWCRCPASPATSGRRSASTTTRSPAGATAGDAQRRGGRPLAVRPTIPGWPTGPPLVVAATLLRDAGSGGTTPASWSRESWHDRAAGERRCCGWRCGSSRTSSWSASGAARSPRRSAWSTRTRSGSPPRSARSPGDCCGWPAARTSPSPSTRTPTAGSGLRVDLAPVRTAARRPVRAAVRRGGATGGHAGASATARGIRS